MNIEKPTSKLLRSKDYIASEDEVLVLEKLKTASKCPYHQWCSPELIGPKRLLPEFALEASDWSDWHLEQRLYLIFKDALLFPKFNWTCFCRECAMQNPTPGKHNRFGSGFSSQHSWKAALRGWENACDRACKRMINDALRGRILLSSISKTPPK
jgi:hypothetical protein